MSKPNEIIIHPTKHPDKATERDAVQMAWAEIQSCGSDENGAPDGEWIPVPGIDVPEWARGKEVMGNMMNGQCCRNDAQGGGRWYRAVHCQPPGLNLAGVH